MNIVRSAALLAIAALSALAPAQARTLEQIRALQGISVCAHPDALPYASNKGDLPGYQVEIARAVADKLGVGLRVEWLVPRRRINEVNCDMLMDRPSGPGPQEGRLLTIPYQQTGVVLAVREDTSAGSVADLKQLPRVGAMVGSLASVVLGRQGVRTTPYAFQSDMLEDLIQGRLPAAATSEPTLSFFLRQNGGKVQALPLFEWEPELGWSQAIALRGADDALLEAVNRALSELMEDGTLERIYARYGIPYRRP